MTFFDSLMNNTIVIRGTGVRAARLMDFVYSLEQDVPVLYNELQCAIAFFVDNDLSKQGKTFYDKKIFSNESVAEIEGRITYVVAIAGYENAFENIELPDLDNIRVMSDVEFIGCIKRCIISGRYEITNENLKEKVQIAKMILDEKFEEAKLSIGPIMNITKQFAPNRVVKTLFYLYSADIMKYKWIKYQSAESCDILPMKVKTVGVFVSQFGGGGAERVVSYLIPLFVQKEYIPVLFTELDVDNEYDMPVDVIKVKLDSDPQTDFDRFIDDRYNALIENGVDVVCFHMPYEGFQVFYEVLLCKLMGIRTIVEFHTSFINAYLQRGELGRNRNIYLIADRMVVLSRTDETFWRDAGVDATYIPNPCLLRTDDGGTHSLETMSRKKHTILWIGRINQKYKRVMDIVPIVMKVKDYIPDVKLLVVGDDALDVDVHILRKTIVENNLSDTISLCGFTNDVDEYYKKAEVMLMTSPGEGFPMVLLEAKAFGLPTIMYDLPYVELVKDKRGIITTKIGDIEAMASAIVSFFADNYMQNRMSIEAKQSYDDFSKYDVGRAWNLVLQGEKLQENNIEQTEKERRLIKKIMVEQGIGEDDIWI